MMRLSQRTSGPLRVTAMRPPARRGARQRASSPQQRQRPVRHLSGARSRGGLYRGLQRGAGHWLLMSRLQTGLACRRAAAAHRKVRSLLQRCRTMLCGAPGVAGMCCLQSSLALSSRHTLSDITIHRTLLRSCNRVALACNGIEEGLLCGETCRCAAKGHCQLAVQSNHTTPCCQSSSGEVGLRSGDGAEGLHTCRRELRRTTLHANGPHHCRPSGSARVLHDAPAARQKRQAQQRQQRQSQAGQSHIPNVAAGAPSMSMPPQQSSC